MADGGKLVTESTQDSLSPQMLGQLASLGNSRPSREPPTSLHIPRANRPAISSQHSNSLPSTPYVQARKLSDDYQAPPPAIPAALVSPRSSRSESDGATRTPIQKNLLGGCKYETGMAYSRRRIPYSFGSDILEPVQKVKKSLDPAEESKLSGDMRELYDRILPSAESEKRRSDFVAKLEKLLNDKWPGSDIKVHVFGSSGNMLYTNDSDVDICITTPRKELERVCLLAKALAEHGMERVVCVSHAKVPIVKIWDPELQLACDMNVNNTLALENTRMMRTYVEIDPRVRPLAMVIKHWTRRRILNDAALGGTLSSYTWICMIINFLQTRKPRILPSLQARPHACLKDAQGKASPFADDLTQLVGCGDSNKETLGELLFHFFRRYGHEIDFEKQVVSVREGALISKKAKSWHLMHNNRLCVEEPFNTERNLGNTADDISFRGVHLELRRAFHLVSQGKLKEACEEFVFPPFEEKIFHRPAPQPRPILTRSLSQQGRKGSSSMQAPSNRNNNSNNSNNYHHHHQQQQQQHHKSRTGSSGRRASSSAAMNKMPPLPHLQPAVPGSASDRLSGNQIHDQLYQHYQLLQVQEQQLRLQMHQRQTANYHAQITAQLPTNGHHQLQIPMAQYSQQGTMEGRRRQSNVEPAPLSAPMRSVHNLYSPVQMGSPSNSSRSPQPNSTHSSSTNPSSPSMSAANHNNGGGRRASERNLVADSSTAARSHSQPPRFSGGNLNLSSNFRHGSRAVRPSPQTPSFHETFHGGLLGISTLQQIQQAYLQGKRVDNISLQQVQNWQLGQASPAESPRLGPMAMDGSDDVLNQRQYVGYYVDQGPNAHDVDRGSLVPQIPPYQDYTQRNGRRSSVSPNVSRLRSNDSRSPSPSYSNISRNHSLSQLSNVSMAEGLGRGAATDFPVLQSSKSSARDDTPRNGPVIVDGSSETSEYATPPESLFFPVGPSEQASLSDDQPCHTPSGASIATAQDQAEAFALEPPLGYRLANSLPNILQFGEFPARATGRSGRTPIRTDEKKTPETQISPASATRTCSDERTNGLGIEFTTAGPSEPTPTYKEAPEAPLKPVQQTSSRSSHAPSPIPLPLLSPVREVRTPSPTVSRKSSELPVDSQKPVHRRSISLSGKDMVSSPLSRAPNPATSKDNAADLPTIPRNATSSNKTESERTASSSQMSKPPDDKPQASTSKQATKPLASEWQQTISKRNRKNRKANSVGNAILKPEQGERKGG